jgi:hypothetical protein
MNDGRLVNNDHGKLRFKGGKGLLGVARQGGIQSIP